MKRALLGFAALALVATLGTACTESRSDRVGERPGDRTPSASPPTTTSPSSPSAAPSTSTDTTTSGAPATGSSGSTSSSGTK